mgnify:CR=1 FL=1
MTQYYIYAVGFTAQILFSARLLVQWISSERAGKVLSPLLFWQLSVLASFFLMLYGILRQDLAVITGQTITYGVYIRNLYYKDFWNKIPALVRFFVICYPALAFSWLLWSEQSSLAAIFKNPEIGSLLMSWGVASQFIFTFRYVYQWYWTERQKESYFPLGFWLISITGSLMVFSYAIMRKDPVLFIGQLFGSVVYTRNIIIWFKQRRNNGEAIAVS